MAEGPFESDFFKEWETLLNDEQPAMSLRKKNKESSSHPPSRLEGETEEQRERRLKLARECSSRRRSTETLEQRKKRLVDQRTRMSLKRKTESAEERELRLKKAREREAHRRQSETGDKRERRLRYSREKASQRREKETPVEREKRLESSRLRASQRRNEKKLLNFASESSSSSVAGPSPTAPKPKPRARPARPRSSRTSNEKRTVSSRQTIDKNSMSEDTAVVESYDNASSHMNKATMVPVSASSGFTNSMVASNARQELISDIVGLSTSPQSHNTLPPQLSSALGGESPISNMIFPPGGGNNFQPPPPPPPLPFASDLHENGENGGRVGEEVLEGMGFLERRYHHHPDFSVHEQQSRGYNIQAVVLRNS